LRLLLRSACRANKDVDSPVSSAFAIFRSLCGMEWYVVSGPAIDAMCSFGRVALCSSSRLAL
jgi:hypothetical protein